MSVVTTTAPAIAGGRRFGLLVPLLASGGLMALMYTAVSSILSELAQHLPAGHDAALLAQLFMAMPSIGMMVGGVLSAWLVGPLGSRKLLFAGLLLYGASGSSALYSSHVDLLLATRLLLGLGSAAVATACTALLAEHFDEADRRRYIGFQSAIGAVAGLVSTLLAGALAATLGWRAPFAFYLVAFGLLAAAALNLPAPVRAPAPAALPAGSARGGIDAVLPWRQLWPLYLLCLPLYAAVFMTMTQVPFLLRDDGTVDPVVQSWVLAMSSLWNAVGAARYGRVRTRLGAERTFAVALTVMAAGHLTLGLSHHAVLTAVGCALAGAGSGLVVPHVPNMLIDRVQGAARGRALGLMYTALYLGSFCNPLVMAPVVAAAGRHGALIVSAGLLVLGAGVVAWRGVRHLAP